MNITSNELENVLALAAVAASYDTEELYDSPEGVEAENELFDAVRPLLPSDLYEQLEDYCLKATLTERIDAALYYAHGQVQR